MTIVAPDFQRKPASRRTTRDAHNVVPLPRLQRSFGEAQVTFKRQGCSTVLDQVDQSGCCKVRFPRPESGAAPEAILINTAGGLTDGDYIATNVRCREKTRAVFTTQAAERIYKSRGAPARIANTVVADSGSTALWLPQETILFDGGRFVRRLEASVAEGARLLACESTVFGRTAMGEAVENGELLDSWRVRYAGRLVFADGFRLSGNPEATLARPAVANGANAIATLICVGEDAPALLEPVRAALEETACNSGCSVIGPVLLVRLLGASGAELRHDLTMLLDLMLSLFGQKEANARHTLPRVWSC